MWNKCVQWMGGVGGGPLISMFKHQTRRTHDVEFKGYTRGKVWLFLTIYSVLYFAI